MISFGRHKKGSEYNLALSIFFKSLNLEDSGLIYIYDFLTLFLIYDFILTCREQTDMSSIKPSFDTMLNY